MHEQRTPNPARLLAPAALVLVTVVFLLIILNSGGGGGGNSSGSGPATHQSRGSSGQSTAPPGSKKRSYTVRAGDTLGAIATKTGVPVDKLLQLNPQLDPQALVSGQKIKLRQ
jgi:LysM repeat protein